MVGRLIDNSFAKPHSLSEEQLSTSAFIFSIRYFPSRSSLYSSRVHSSRFNISFTRFTIALLSFNFSSSVCSS